MQQPVKRFEDSILLAVSFRNVWTLGARSRLRIIPCYLRRGDPRPPCKPEEDHPRRYACPEPEIRRRARCPRSPHDRGPLPFPSRLLCSSTDPYTKKKYSSYQLVYNFFWIPFSFPYLFFTHLINLSGADDSFFWQRQLEKYNKLSFVMISMNIYGFSLRMDNFLMDFSDTEERFSQCSEISNIILLSDVT